MTLFLSLRRLRYLLGALALAVLLNCPSSVHAQTPTATASPAPSNADANSANIRELQSQIGELKQILLNMNAEMTRSREETQQLREQLDAMRQQIARIEPAAQLPEPVLNAQTQATAPQQNPASDQDQRILRLEEQLDLQKAAIAEQHQTKVESASKFHVRLSGAVIFDVINNVGSVDNLDFPSLATTGMGYGANGSFGMSLRQSLIGLDVFGPTLGNARVSGNVQFDFAGGFQDTENGAVLGLPRLRTGVIRIAGSKTDLVAGQDILFFSPLSPSSFVSSALPEFSYSGNLWTWTPQVRVEHRFDVSETSRITVQGGILDPLAGEVPPNQTVRTPGPGETTRIPAFATRVAWTYNVFNRDFTIGAGGYYTRQDWRYDRHADGWAGTADWLFPLTNRWELSGEFYRGRAIGGLGGALGRSVVADGSIYSASTEIQPLNATGGWAQLKFRQTDKLEWNGAFGQDNTFAADLHGYPYVPDGYLYPSVARNRGSMFNFIYRPRSDLVFSVEYLHLRTFMIQGTSQTADHVDVGMGILF